jgi:hypothetical protein
LQQIYAADSDFRQRTCNTNTYQELLRQHVVPWVQGDVA